MKSLATADELDEVYGALADASRRSMVAALSTRRLRVKDLAAVFPFSLNATSKHLKVLERAGIIERQVRGREHFFALRPGVLEEAKDWIEHYEDFGGQTVQTLDALLTAPLNGSRPPEDESPPFPDSPGGWLAYYRYRTKTPSERHLSRGALGEVLGVSGATVQRWEDGSALPSEAELHRIAGICGLTPFQTAFLLRVFRARSTEAPPEETAYRKWASKALAVDYPCVVFDSLYYVRAWNEQFVEMFPTVRLMTRAWHGIELYQRIFEQGNPLIDLNVLVRCLREVWWRTAPFCGNPAYREMLAEARKIPNLELAWTRFGHSNDDQQVGAPYMVSAPAAGSYQVVTLPVSLPQAYYLRSYAPCDDRAREITAAVVGQDVYFVPRIHWAETAY